MLETMEEEASTLFFLHGQDIYVLFGWFHSNANMKKISSIVSPTGNVRSFKSFTFVLPTRRTKQLISVFVSARVGFVLPISQIVILSSLPMKLPQSYVPLIL
jgi:hypothetical protein